MQLGFWVLTSDSQFIFVQKDAVTVWFKLLSSRTSFQLEDQVWTPPMVKSALSNFWTRPIQLCAVSGACFFLQGSLCLSLWFDLWQGKTSSSPPSHLGNWIEPIKGINRPSVSGSVKHQRQQQRQRHQCKSMVTLHLTLLIAPRSIA